MLLYVYAYFMCVYVYFMCVYVYFMCVYVYFMCGVHVHVCAVCVHVYYMYMYMYMCGVCTCTMYMCMYIFPSHVLVPPFGVQCMCTCFFLWFSKDLTERAWQPFCTLLITYMYMYLCSSCQWEMGLCGLPKEVFATPTNPGP